MSDNWLFFLLICVPIVSLIASAFSFRVMEHRETMARLRSGVVTEDDDDV